MCDREIIPQFGGQEGELSGSSEFVDFFFDSRFSSENCFGHSRLSLSVFLLKLLSTNFVFVI